MATQTTDLIGNGDFETTGGLGNWANWQSSGTFDSSGPNAPTYFDNNLTNTLTYSGLSGLDVGPGANGAGQLSLDVGWADASGGTTGSPATLEIRVAGVLVATITTPDGNGSTASIAFSNGASGNLNALNESTFGAFVLQTLTIELPANIPASGALEIAISSDTDIADNFQIDNVSLLVTEDIPETADAVDDAVSLTEDEAGGDTDLNVLTNDVAGTGEVAEVNGSAGNVGNTVDGSNGGTFTIGSDGSVDFDADGDFEALGVGESEVTTVTYKLTDVAPFDPGSQTATSSTDVGGASQTGTFTFTTGEFTNDGTTAVDATVTLSDPAASPVLNVVFVIDVSGSTGDPFVAGSGQTILQAEVEALQNLSDDLAGLGFPAEDIEIALVTFSGNAAFVGTFEPGSTALDNTLNNLSSGGTTNFEAALDSAGAALQDLTQGLADPSSVNNVIYFLSDGVPISSGPFEDEADSLIANFGADIVGVGVGSGASLSDLNLIDNTVETGQTAGSSAVQVTTTAGLADAVDLSPIIPADLTAFRILVDGVEVPGITIDDLDQSGFTWTLDIDGIDPDILSGLNTTFGATSVITAEATFDDGTVLTNVVEVETAPNTMDTATVTVTVTGVNDGPDALDDTAGTGAESTTTIDLTANDTDPDLSDDLEILSVDTIGTVGTVTVNADNDTVDYDPNGQFTGLADGETALDTFTYTVTDGNGGQDTATVTVTITGANDGPDALPDSATVGEDDTTPTTIDLTANDTDPDLSDDLEILSVDTTGTLGTVTVNPDNDTVDYDPNGQFESLAEGETALDTFTYTVTDGNGGTDTETVTVTITGANDSPDALDDTAGTGAESTTTIDLTA
ncbi:MAG: Ig-like domain-containing protein, partial [Pseudomonadota bacterium]